MATVDEAIAAAAQVEELLKAAQLRLQDLNGARCARMAAQLRLQDLNGAISRASGSRARDEAKAIAHQLGEQAETFTQQGESALESDNQASEVAFNTLARILRDAQYELERAVHEGEDDHGAIPEALSGIRQLVEEAEATRGRLEQAAARPPPPPQSPKRAPSTAVKWVTADYEGGPLRARVEALEVLKEVDPSTLLNVVTVVGPARKGKSFLMNALAGRNGVFPVSPAVEPCTAGADLSPILMPLPSFAQLGRDEFDRSAPAPVSPTIAFVDLEGQGDKSVEHGVRLAMSFLVLSKVIIYNWLQHPNKQTMLNELVVMVKAAEKVLREDKEGGHGDQNGEANGEETPSFGHLIILTRDVEGNAKEIENLVIGMEQTRGLKYQEKLEAGQRNLIREGLESAFESITFHTMPPPHPDIAGGAVPLSDVVPGFTTSLNELRGIIAEHLATGHQFAGKEIAGGERLHATVVHLCEAINSTGDICPPSVLVAIETRLADAEVQKAVVRFDNVMGPTLGGRFPLTSQETTNAIVCAKDNALKHFDEATQGITASIAEGKRMEVEKQIALKAEVAAHNQEQRRHGLKRKMDSLASQHKASIAEKAKLLGFPLDEKDLEKEWSKLVSLCFSTLDRAIKSTVTRTLETGEEEVHQDLLEDLGWASSRKDFEARVKDTHHFIQELNNRAIAGKKDRKAREEAEKKMGQLTEQVESTKREVDAALAEAKKARKAANDAQARAATGASQSQSSLGMMMMALMGGGGYPGMGSGYPVMGGGYPGYSSGSMGGGRFYAGGQLIPGGGRAPQGGCFIG